MQPVGGGERLFDSAASTEGGRLWPPLYEGKVRPSSALRSGGRARKLLGREAECGVLDALVEAARRGESRSLVVRGDPGVGKSALLDYLADRASDCRVVSVTAAQSEMRLAFAGLHQLCSPMLDRLELLVEPQRAALGITFGLLEGPAPDRLLVGLAVLSLLAEVAATRPLVCRVDDEQWLDRASAQVLAFVARRLRMESVALVLAARVPSDELTGLPELVIGGLKRDDARLMLASVMPGPLDERVQDQIIAATGGNPLALLELTRGLTMAELAGGFGLPGGLVVSRRLEECFQRRVAGLPRDVQRLLLLAAADPFGDSMLLWRAAGRLGIDPSAARPAVEASLGVFGTRVGFRHPLVRSVMYHSASGQERQEVHRALAEVMDPTVDPDRRAWHRAAAAPGPDEDVAAELEGSAGRAQARGGVAAAAAFLERAALLTPDPVRLRARALAAAEAKVQAGALDAAVELLAVAEAGLVDEAELARADLLRAKIAFVANRGSDAAVMLLSAAKRLERIAPALAQASYLNAIAAANYAGRLAAPGGSMLDVAGATRSVAADAPTATGTLVAGFAANVNQGYASALPILRRALTTLGDNMSDERSDVMHLAYMAAVHIWSDSDCDVISDRWSILCRESGALSDLPIALNMRVLVLLLAGDVGGAALLVEEAQAATEAIGIDFGPYGALGLAAFRGDEGEASALIDASIEEALLRGEGVRLSAAEWASAVLNNGLGRYQQALAAAERASGNQNELVFTNWVLSELIEAAARTGQKEAAFDAHRRLDEMSMASQTDWISGLAARSRALLSEGGTAEAFYREAIERLGRTRIRVELGRAHLVYGEWLRRQQRPGEARTQLRTASGLLEAMGIGAFAERARRELQATGERVRKRNVGAGAGAGAVLTTRESHVAKLARDGLSNPEIGAHLYISARTVEYHLSKVYTKLGITSRAQLDRVLA